MLILTVIWGYSPDDKLNQNKVIGQEISEMKQVFSALLFESGINGIIIRIESIQKKTEAIMQLIVDNELIISENFYPTKPGDFKFNTKDTIRPKTKIEVVVKLISGSMHLPISAIGNGMGFLKRNETYKPTNHLGLGLIIPDD